MNAPKFTPGPWKLDARDPRYIRSVKTWEYIARRQSSNLADGPLLRAAPELYAALAKATDFIGYMLDHLPEDKRDNRVWIDCRAALAKAVA